jgi:hypothetical protein
MILALLLLFGILSPYFLPRKAWLAVNIAMAVTASILAKSVQPMLGLLLVCLPIEPFPIGRILRRRLSIHQARLFYLASALAQAACLVASAFLKPMLAGVFVWGLLGAIMLLVRWQDELDDESSEESQRLVRQALEKN